MARKFGRRFRRNSRASLPSLKFLTLGSTDSVFGPHNQQHREEEANAPQEIALKPVEENVQTLLGSEGDVECRAPPQQQDYAPTWKCVAIMIALCLAVLCMALDNTILATAIPKITEEFNSVHDMGWYVSAYMLAQSSMTLVYGKLLTYYTVKWVYIAALLLFEGGSLICGVSPNSIALIIGRAISGTGGSGILVSSFLIVTIIVPVEKRPLYNGILSSLYAISGVFGPLLGGAFTDYATWRWCFYINLPVGGVTGFFILLLFRADKPTKQWPTGAVSQLLELDIIGLFLFIPALVSLLLVLQWGGSKYPWDDAHIIALIAVFGVTILAFAAVEYWQQDRATIPPSMIRNRDIWGSLLFTFCLSGSVIIFNYYLPIWFQSIKNASATMSGVMNIPLILAVALTSILSGWAVTTLGYYIPFMYATPVIASVGAGLLSTFKVSSAHPAWIGFQILYGIGVGLGFGLPLVVVQATLTAHTISSGTALVTLTQGLAGALFNFVAQSVFQTKLVQALFAEAPSLDAGKIAEAGATVVRDIVDPDMVPAVLRAYNYAITRVYLVGAALAAAALLGVVPIRWGSVKGKKIEAGAA
ncbi:MFS toxin efflux pump [Aspergillus ustus]|uniref:MFS-type transporter opaD n=1 Tax=Aspergillus ustus TaxID=40382 RepID=OPAD_ASPUT|nr:RecName: Full=MFS-type transporter opaD; AltName: Full=Oxepinamide F biosynthesis cluster protein D [Aspergillus ustus]KIA75455.1 MFS toxin efflux pump [Aspergillus ustus]